MRRYIAIVEEINLVDSTCKVRVPNLDGLEKLASLDPGIAILRQMHTSTNDLQTAAVPYHLQGLRLKDIVFVLDSEDDNDNYTITGFYGGVSE
jgi:hypothetical protein